MKRIYSIYAAGPIPTAIWSAASSMPFCGWYRKVSRRSRGRGRAYVHHDRVNHRLRARRGARLAAITSGGAIPDTANYAVIAEPDGTVVGSVDEDFAVESLAGDIILLGNASWRIRGVETGKVRVEDAHGAPPTIPFWRGEAPSRTAEVLGPSRGVRAQIDRLMPANGQTDHAPVMQWLQRNVGWIVAAPNRPSAYVSSRPGLLGEVPTQDTDYRRAIFRRGRRHAAGASCAVRRAHQSGLGAGAEKRFCTTFDFELQAAATDEGSCCPLVRSIVRVGHDLRFSHRTPSQRCSSSCLQAPMFMTRWRWNASRALALLRFGMAPSCPADSADASRRSLGRRVFPARQRCQVDHPLDSGASCRRRPDHPLVNETIRDCLTEAMDLDGLIDVLQRIEAKQIRCVAIDTPMPSPFCHEILNANPYAYLDDAPLEERRARAVEMRRSLPPELAGQLGALNPQAIAEVAAEVWPVVRDADELHDALLTLVWAPEAQVQAWAQWLTALTASGRAAVVTIHDGPDGARVNGWVATERAAALDTVFPHAAWVPSRTHMPEDVSHTRDESIVSIVQGWMESIGPTTAEALAARLHLALGDVDGALLRLESQGQVLRGRFTTTSDGSAAIEWCDRRLLARIHRLTIGSLRREVQPVTATEFMRFLFQWQHVAPASRLHGEAGLLEIVKQLAGFEAAASAWERHLLPLRSAKYDPDWVDGLCLGGSVMWGRLSPHPRLDVLVD